MPVLRKRVFALAMLFSLLPGAAAPAQSLREDAPAHLVAGLNRATLDSGAGSHYWEVTVTSGKFRIVFAGDGPQQMFSAGHQPRVSMTLLPERQSAIVAQRGIPGGGTVCEGSVTQRTRVLLVVEPVKSAVREMTDYTLVVTGNIDGGAGAGKPAD